MRRARAQTAGAAEFLHIEAAALVSERLQEINRTFPDRCLVGPMPGPWRAAGIADRAIADDDILDVVPESLDLIVHALALHSANDPVGQLIQCRRALRPDGLMLAVLFGGGTLHELRAALATAEIGIRGGLSPRVHPSGDIRDLGGLVQRAGLAQPVADAVTLTATYTSLRALMHDLRAMAETNVLTARDRRGLTRDMLRAAEAAYRDTHARPDGRLTATYDLLFLTGWAADDSQQVPLRPGSATARLADALGTVEHATGARPDDADG